MTFGEFIRNLRIEKRLTLRDFCRSAKLDPSNWSRIERGFAPPPKSKVVLQGIAKILKIEEGSEEYNTLFDLAAIGHIPTGLVSDEQVLDKLPVFFRTIRGEKPSRKELEELIRIMKEE
ncbi:MAG: helix-turn-helix domain-containing protein [Candidatus Aminicenantes bacterium]|nr:helix-turn-helix domain-containing protein [Candidatus Aminicenantes bacterium]